MVRKLNWESDGETERICIPAISSTDHCVSSVSSVEEEMLDNEFDDEVVKEKTDEDDAEEEETVVEEMEVTDEAFVMLVGGRVADRTAVHCLVTGIAGALGSI